MLYLRKKILIYLIMIVISATAISSPAFAKDVFTEVSGEGMAFDLVLLRPLGLAATAIGCAFFVASLPFTVWTKERFKKAGNNFVIEPATYTFVRPLGEIRNIRY